MKILVFLLIFCLNAVAETDFKIITLQYLFASDLLPIIQPMVGPDGTVNGMNNQLIIHANSERMREIVATIASLDVARVNRKITVKITNNVQTQQNSTEMTGAVSVGKIIVGNDKRTQNSDRPNSARVDLERNGSNSYQNSNQFISVLDGERAFIKVGQIVPFTQEWVTITRHYMQIERSVTFQTSDWREIATGFTVRPRTIGNPNNKQVELEITPRIAKLNNSGYIDFENLKTIISVKLGDWVDIGGTMQSKDEVSREILGIHNSVNQQQSSLIVKVD